MNSEVIKMDRRKFLKGAATTLALPVALTAPTQADAFVITLAAVAKVASIGGSVLSFFGKGTNSTPQLVLENYRLLIGVHEKLDELEALIIEVLKSVNAIPVVLQKEIDAGLERATNKRILAIVKSYEESLTVFSAARKSGQGDEAYPVLISNAQQNHNAIQNLRNELSYYSAYSLMAIAASSATELSLYVLQGGNPSSYGILRKFNKELLARHEDHNQIGSLANDIKILKTKYDSSLQTVRNYLGSFPAKGNATTKLVDSGYHLRRCTIYGYPLRPLGGVNEVRGGGQNMGWQGYMNLNKIFERHEQNKGRKKYRDGEQKTFTKSFVTASRIQLSVDTFTAGDQNIPILDSPYGPEVLSSGGAFDGFDCTSKVIGRPNTNDRDYQNHIITLHKKINEYNLVAESYGVLLEYQKQVRSTFEALDVYLGSLGVPA
jgi:hypothetical protein